MIINPYRFSAAAADVPRDGLIAEYLFDTDASDTAGEAGGPYAQQQVQPSAAG